MWTALVVLAVVAASFVVSSAVVCAAVWLLARLFTRSRAATPPGEGFSPQDLDELRKRFAAVTAEFESS